MCRILDPEIAASKKKTLVYESDSDGESTLEPGVMDHVNVAASLKRPCPQKDVVGSVYGKFSGDFPNHGISGEYSRSDYPHSNELNRVSTYVNITLAVLLRVLYLESFGSLFVSCVARWWEAPSPLMKCANKSIENLKYECKVKFCD